MTDVERRKFHVERSISWGHIATIVVVIVTATVFVIRTENKIERNTQSIRYIESRIEREVSRSAEQNHLIREHLTRIEEKLDRYIERED